MSESDKYDYSWLHEFLKISATLDREMTYTEWKYFEDMGTAKCQLTYMKYITEWIYDEQEGVS